jgi:hypothetical protein
MAERQCCSKCGKPAACGCNAPYVSKLEYAKAHMKPDKSDRVNGKELGVSKDTVRRAGKQLAQKAPVGAKRKGQDGKLRRLPKKKKNGNGTGRPGRPRTDAYYSMKTANRLRGKARSEFMKEWAIWESEKRMTPDLIWLRNLDEAVRRFITLDKELREGDNWQKYEITPCTFGLVSECIGIMNRWVNMFQPKLEENKNVVHH